MKVVKAGWVLKIKLDEKGNIDKYKALFGEPKRTSLNEGIGETVEWIKEQLKK